MNTRFAGRQLVVAVSLALGVAWPGWAEDNSNTVFTSGTAINLGAPLIIGNTGTNNTLLISNGSRVTNTVGTIGNGAAANFNRGTVTGSGSVWYHDGTGGGGYGTFVGNQGSSNTLVISNGGVVNGGGFVAIVGHQTTAIGNQATVTGTGSIWTNLNALRVGGDVGGGSSNRLTITNGGKVHVNQLEVGWASLARGNQVIISSGGSLSTGVAASSVGVNGDDNELIIQSGGKLISAGRMDIGGSANAERNRLLVTGSGSVYTNISGDGIRIGDFGRGNSLVISNGGRVYTEASTLGFQYIGFNAGASNNYLQVTGANSSYINRYGLTVGHGGSSNSLFVGTGGSVILQGDNAGFDYGLTIGATATSADNLVRIDGGRLVVTNNLASNPYIDVRRGTFELNGGTVETERFFATNGTSSIAALNGGLMVSRGTQISNGGAFTIGNGSGATADFRMRGGTHTFVDGLTIATDGILSGTGTVVGVVNQVGIIAPGFSPGQINITGNLTQAFTATLQLEIGGLDQGVTYDFLNITGDAFLAGNLDVSLWNGFLPDAANSFTVMTANAISGVFSNMPVSGGMYRINGGFFTITYDDQHVILGNYVVPEPSVLLLVGTGALLMYGYRRKQRRTAGE